MKIMKSTSIILLLLVLTATSYAQEKGQIKATELPGVVIKRVGKDFSIYLPDNNPDQRVRAIEEKFVTYDLGKENEGYEEYLLVMKGKNGELAATYDENGKLTRIVENYKNVILPTQVIYSIYKAYPKWTIVNDKFLYTQEAGDVIKKQYNVKIKKDKEVKRIVIKSDGEILKIR
jgi:hypothetical protein